MRSIPLSRPATAWFIDRPVGVKVGTALGTLAVVAVGITGLAADRIGHLRDAEQVLYTDTVLPLTELSEIQRSFQGDRARVIQYAIADAKTRKELRTELAERRVDIQAQIDAYRPKAVDDASFAEFEKQLAAYYELVEQGLFPFADAGDLRTYGLVFQEQVRPQTTALVEPLQAENVAQSELAEERAARDREDAGRRSRRPVDDAGRRHRGGRRPDVLGGAPPGRDRAVGAALPRGHGDRRSDTGARRR